MHTPAAPTAKTPAADTALHMEHNTVVYLSSQHTPAAPTSTTQVADTALYI